MMVINAENLDFQTLNALIRSSEGDCAITRCRGQRFIAAGAPVRDIVIEGTPGNALGAYLNGARVAVRGNAQDAVGDTMNDGVIAIHGSVGDTAGYAMRGGRIYVKGSAGYRAGIHMKAYREKLPVMVIGETAGSFLGEYQAGGLIIVLDISRSGKPIVSNFPGAGMHGGKMFLRSDCEGILFPPQVKTRAAGREDMAEIAPYLREFCEYFGYDCASLSAAPFTVVTPDSSNPYHQMYVEN